MDIFNLDGHPHVELCDLLKIQGWADSGAAAKQFIADGQVTVDGETETCNAAKLPPVKWWNFAGQQVKVAE